MVWWEPGAPAAMAARARTGLQQAWGLPAQVVGAAPGRVNLIGEHTDYNRGLCLPFALPHATYVAARLRTDGHVRIASAQTSTPWIGTVADGGPGRVTGWASYVAGMLWALAEHGWPVPGVDLYVDSTVPVGAGLSSSAALEGATGTAVAGILGYELADPAVAASLVAAGVRAESEVAGAPTGGMDQAIAVYGSSGSALLLDFEDGSRTGVPLNLGTSGLTVVVIDTQVRHALCDGEYATRRCECEQAARLIGVHSLRAADLAQVASITDPVARRRARHVVTENARVRSVQEALIEGRADTIGAALSASHASLRDDFEVSCAEVDLVVDTAVSSGALGARMTGGGFGGSAVALVPEARLDQLRARVRAAAVQAGHPEPRFLRAEPASGARLLE